MSARAKYMVKVSGCDDTTRVSYELTPTQAELVRSIAAKVTTAGGGCKPTMHLIPWDDTDEYDREECEDAELEGEATS